MEGRSFTGVPEIRDNNFELVIASEYFRSVWDAYLKVIAEKELEIAISDLIKDEEEEIILIEEFKEVDFSTVNSFI